MERGTDRRLIALAGGTPTQGGDAAIAGHEELDALLARGLREPALLGTDGYRRRLARVVRLALLGRGFTRADVMDSVDARLEGAAPPLADRVRALVVQALAPIPSEGGGAPVVDMAPLLAKLAGTAQADEGARLVLAHLSDHYGPAAGFVLRFADGLEVAAGAPVDGHAATTLAWTDGAQPLATLTASGLTPAQRDRLAAGAAWLQPALRRLAEARSAQERLLAERRAGQAWRVKAELLALAHEPSAPAIFQRRALALLAKLVDATYAAFWAYDATEDSLERAAEPAGDAAAAVDVPAGLFQEVVLAREPRTAALPDGQGALRVFLLAPVFIDDALAGVIQLVPATPALGPDAEAVLAAAAEAIARGLQSARFFEQLSYQASHDPLTGLANRRTFEAFLDRELKLAERHHTALSVVVIDADHFKQYNDTYGHPAGDALLKALGARLAHVARSTDFVARYGGEEFVVVLPHTEQAGAVIAAGKILEGIRTLHEHAELHRPLTASVGVATFPSGVFDARELFNAADQAMYRAKHAGRDRVVHYND